MGDNKKELGRHYITCLEVKRRLASSVLFHTIHELVNDTIYRELHINTIIQITLMIISILFIGTIHSKWTRDDRLPITKIKTL